VRLTLGASDATLTDDQIEQAVKAVLNQLARDLDAHQRV
jgi:phenylalanyl-tRNA synthetase beta subunit